jgi:hypothetical protein
LLIFALTGFVNLTSVDRYFARRFNAEPNHVAAHIDDGNDYVVTDNDALVTLPG